MEAARLAGTPMTSPICLLWDRLPAAPLGVTGTRGKTTTATLLHAMISRAGIPARLGGNVGGSLLTDVASLGEESVVVLELSSFQLHWLRRIRRSPRIAVVTNLSPHHLDWHGDMARYTRAKRGILEFQGPRETAVLNGDDPALLEWGPGARGAVEWFSTAARPGSSGLLKDGTIRILIDDVDEEICSVDEIPMRGTFQAANVMAAAMAARRAGVRPEAIREAVLRFPGLPHRLERVAIVRGVAYYNDSKATTPAAAGAAIRSVDGPVFWIGGGKDTGESLTPLSEAAAGRVRKAYLLGEAAPRMARQMAGAVALREVCETLEEAVRQARTDATEGSTVLLSPGCASYDQFLNYEHRGETFRSLVLGDNWKPGS
jgi:UDP-N-acetylmuramoylalanine--D-glutamate ligase